MAMPEDVNDLTRVLLDRPKVYLNQRQCNLLRSYKLRYDPGEHDAMQLSTYLTAPWFTHDDLDALLELDDSNTEGLSAAELRKQWYAKHRSATERGSF